MQGYPPPSGYGPPPSQGYGPMQPQQQEPVFLNTAGAFVSRSRVVLNGVTYPVNAISHVRLFVMKKSPWVLIIGIIAGLIAFAQFASGNGENGAILMIIAVVMIVIYFKAMFDQYGIALGASGAERNAIISKDQAFIRGIEQAINNALASRY